MKKLVTAENFNFSKGVENFNAGGIAQSIGEAIPGAIFGGGFREAIPGGLAERMAVGITVLAVSPVPINNTTGYAVQSANKSTTAIKRNPIGIWTAAQTFNNGDQVALSNATYSMAIPKNPANTVWKQIYWGSTPSGWFVRASDFSAQATATFYAPPVSGGAPVQQPTPSFWQRIFGAPAQPTPQPYTQPAPQGGGYVYGYDKYGNPLDRYGNPIEGGGYNPNYNPNAADYGQSQQDSDAQAAENAYQAELDNE